jgi:hypothetical protein
MRALGPNRDSGISLGEEKKMKRSRRRTMLGTLAVGAIALMGLAGAPGASAALEFKAAEASLNSTDGAQSRQAGAHSDFTFHFSQEKDSDGYPIESFRSVLIDLPPGMVGNATVATECSQQDFQNSNAGYTACPLESQVGTAFVDVGFDNYVGVFSLEHGNDTAAMFGFNILGTTATFRAGVEPGEYRVTSDALGISQAQALRSVQVKLWGVPAAHSHDTEREPPNSAGIFGEAQSTALPRPFLTNPTSCGSSSNFLVSGDSWEFPGAFDVRTLTADPGGDPFTFEGCESLPFEPTMEVQPSTRSTDTPTGLAVDFRVPQNESPDGYATSHVRKTVLTFPQGMFISASQGAGLDGCSPSEIGLGSNDRPNCPNSSKIGKVKIVSPLLGDELKGDVVLAKPYDNPFGTLLAMYLTVRGPNFYLKLPGRIDPDPVTGQLKVTFDDTPQLPFESLNLELKSGPKAPLSTPKACGNYAVKTEIYPWSGTAPVVSSSGFTIDENCATGGFDPSLRAGSASPAAGGYGAFNFQIARKDGEQNISRIQATLPEGMLAKLAGVGLCSDAGAVTGNCPASSQVGSATAAIGSGSFPLFVPEAGKAPTAVYLAGPYKGAPYSLVVKVPAQAGPFDLGTVAVRNALNIDPVSAQVTVGSDPLPQILKGLPISYREIRVEVNRDQFALNPTSCDPMAVNSTITSDGGKVAHPSSPFQVTNCAALEMKPGLSFKLKGGTKRGDFPALTATLRARSGDANLSRASVTLPHSEFLEQSHIGTVCTRVQFAAKACPAGSIYGYVTATTPLLDKPLSGPVYLRSSDNPLPDLVAALHGQVDFNVSGRIDSVNGGIRTTFDTIPDAPVSTFTLAFKGGKKGLLVNSRDICGIPGRATAKFVGQNGKFAELRPQLRSVSCAKAKKRAKH